MKKTLALVFGLILFSSFTTRDHETYLSVTEVEYNEEVQSIQIISRVFIDDLENVLSKRYQQEISLSYKEDLEKNREIIQKYLEKKLRISVEGKEQKLKLLGSKFDADQVVMFIEAAGVKSFKKVKVENLILTDLFDSQKNIVHVKKDKTIESMLLVKGNGSQTVNF
ncbi:DUF6702 family protein [Christiangramia aestuarii]|uniref:Peptidase E n=1 Tax=Christiangramia aestuarii TaxID=1028746 RepID=A0A7M3SY85_9FLAO|nr:DUF6702 family protein [Christiangramia aestuarii]MUP41566.1 hypothetical protein [Christiangramia aestuarii]